MKIELKGGEDSPERRGAEAPWTFVSVSEEGAELS